ncbi:ATP-binding protein [Pedobacter psychrotolerans]|uniref:ATP-binding protein n=1 Tax=Pedobacter psychrotolerans TaxID=1843235 RepID=UPI003F98B69D
MENQKQTVVPFITTGQAIQSLRFSGFSLEAAIAEVVDNSIEAKANNIYVKLTQKENGKKKYIDTISIVDDGEGMSKEILHHYPQLGFSSRYMREDTIGKYGVGAKLAALNFGKKFDVWSKNYSSDTWYHVYFDLPELLEEEKNGGNGIEIKAPKAQNPPLEFNSLISKTGTVVLWDSLDALQDGKLGSFDEVKSSLEFDLARMFRYFIDGGINIYVNGKKLLAHDPLYLMEGGHTDTVLKNYYSKTGQAEKVKEHYGAKVIADEIINVGGSTATLKVTLYPAEVTRTRGSGGDDLAKKLRVPENEGSISFVRANREVSYNIVPRIFPRGISEPDRFIGIEVSFKPELDTFFGVRNIKRGVEPHGELRKDIRDLLRKYLRTARGFLNDAWGQFEAETKAKHGEHGSVTLAAKEVNSTMPKGKAKGPENESDKNQILDDLAKDATGVDDVKVKSDYLENIKELPFVIESVDFPGNQFIDIKHISNQVIIRLNTRHRFYREMWEPVKSISERDVSTVTAEEAVVACKRTIEALTLLLISYGKAESMEEDPDGKYRDLTNFWGTYLNTMMGKVKNVL